MTTVVAGQGIPAFNNAVSSSGWEAPVIPSDWYVQNVASAEERPGADAARELGSNLLDAIDAWAPLMLTDSNDDVLSKATELLDLAYWLGATEGYGNLILSYRARDVALTGLARRVVDLDEPLEATAEQVERCTAPFDAPIVRSRILNSEAGAQLFPVSPDVTEADLMNVWSRRQAKSTLEAVEQLPTPPAGEEEAYDTLAQLRDILGVLGVEAGSPDSSDSFFVDDELPDPPTTRNLWNRKRHAMIVGHTTPERVYSLERLIRFREQIGQFPQQPTAREEQGSAPGEEAFADAWRPHIAADDTSNLGRAAWAVYDAILRGDFLDFDSRAIRNNLASTPPTPPEPTVGSPTVAPGSETPTP